MQHAKKEYGEVSEWPKEHAWKVCKSQGFEGSNPSLTASIALNRPVSMLLCFMASLVGPRAMIGYEPRQARKGATVVADSCAAVWLARVASSIAPQN